MSRSLLDTCVSLFIGIFASTVASGQEVCKPEVGHVEDCIVFLQIDKTDAETGATVQIGATGFVIGKDGWVLTAAHPITSQFKRDNGTSVDALYPPPIRGRLSKRTTPPEDELRIDTILREYDLALLQYKTFSTPKKILPIGIAGDVEVNSTVLTVRGFPLDLDLDVRTVKVTSKGGRSPLWNLDGGLTFGYSGAPLLSSQGAVVAVAVGDDSRGPEIKYAVPINLANALAARAEAKFSQASAISPAAIAEQLTKVVKVIDLEAEDETRIVRPHVYAFVAPMGKQVESASVVVKNNLGLRGRPTLDISHLTVNMTFELESGPRSAKRRGFLEADLVIFLVTTPP